MVSPIDDEKVITQTQYSGVQGKEGPQASKKVNISLPSDQITSVNQTLLRSYRQVTLMGDLGKPHQG